MKNLKNFTEDIIKQYLNENFINSDVCQCEDCFVDIMAIMLNKIPPHYVATDKGAVFAQLKQMDNQYTANITVALAEAVEIVKKRPKHNV